MSRASSPARWVLCGAALALFSTREAAADTVRYLPGVVHATGARGERFESTVWVTNLGTASDTVSLALVSASASPPPPVTRTLAAGETRRFDDVLRSVFGLESGSGTLVVSGTQPIALRGTTKNVSDPSGTFGLGLVSVGPESALAAGETGHAVWLAHSPDPSRLSRTNVAVVLLVPRTSVTLTLYDEAGFFRGARTIASETPLAFQASVSELAGDPDLRLGRAELLVERGEALGYTAVVDNRTGDGMLFPAVRLAATPAEWLLDGVARARGERGTRWGSDVRLFNPGAAPLEVTLAYSGNAATTRTLKATVPPRGLVELTDVLGSGGLDLPEGSAGGLVARAAAPFLAAFRTANGDPSGATGTFSASEEAVPYAGLATAGRRLMISGLVESPAARTNVALLSGETGAAGTLTLLDAAGAVLARTPFEVGPRSWVQRRLSGWFPEASLEEARVDVEVSAGALDAYASVIDNGTGDPVVVAPVAVPAAGCQESRVTSFTADAPSVAPGQGVTLRLAATAPSGARARVVPGDLAIGLTGSLQVTPRETTSYRVVVEGGCGPVTSATVTVAVAPGELEALTRQGPVSGTSSGSTVSFKGIPYAAPPVGPLRFRPPVAPEPWSGVRDASSFGSACPQLRADGTYHGGEDCLTLNVWAPSPRPAAPLPVLVFVHGGGNIEGEGSLAAYEGRGLAELGPAVVVTLNYRLGALGYLAHPALRAESSRDASGNYGLLDQIAALAWVKRNIPGFGGDAGRVLVFGESAGGFAVCAMLASPLARGLFSRALVESGGCADVSRDDIEAFGRTVVSASGCAGAADIPACLRQRDEDVIVRAVPGESPLTSFDPPLYSHHVDGFALPEPPLDAIRAGRHARVPFAVGTNAEEMALSVPVVLTPFDYQAYLLTVFGPVLGPTIALNYPALAYPSPQKALVAVMSDLYFVCPARRLARAMTSTQDEPVFRYSFSQALSAPSLAPYGAYHGLELPFVFQTLTAFPAITPTAGELALSRSMGAYWTRFARDGDPADAGGVRWPAYSISSQPEPYLDLNERITTGSRLRSATCDFWDRLEGP